MAHSSAIAKATLSASLLRNDPTTVSGDEIARLHHLLDKCITVCSPENIKNCKHWLLGHIVRSESRITAFGKYMVALSSTLKSQADEILKPSSRRRRLHILYLLNDTIHHTTFYSSPSIPFGIHILPFLKELFPLAIDANAKKQLAKLENLLSIWTLKGYYSEETIGELQSAIKKVFEDSDKDVNGTGHNQNEDSRKEQVVMLPAMHGSPTLPYHDLPAATMLPLMRPNSPTPINPRSVRPIPLKAGVPPKPLSDAVDAFIKSVDKMWYGGDLRDLGDVDELGAEITKPLNLDEDDEFMDDLNRARDAEETYFGWTRGFAIKMMKRRKGSNDAEDERSRGSRDRSISYSRSRSRSASRTRRSDRDRRRDASSSVSRSRSKSRSRHRSTRRRRRSYSDGSRSRSRSHSRSRAKRRYRSRSRRSRSRSSVSSQSYSPKPGLSHRTPAKASDQPPPPPLPPSIPNHGAPFTPPILPPQMPFPGMNQQFPIPLPIPPEVAQMFAGGLPPPPPPPPMTGSQQAWGMNMPFSNIQAPPGPPIYGQWNTQGQMNMPNMFNLASPSGQGGRGYGHQQHHGRGNYQNYPPRGGSWNNRGGGGGGRW